MLSFGKKSAGFWANHPAEHGIEFNVVMAVRAHASANQFRPFAFAPPSAVQRGRTIAEAKGAAIIIFDSSQAGGARLTCGPVTASVTRFCPPRASAAR